MKNLTLAIEEDVLREARKYAAERETTVNALVREYLTGLVSQQERSREARRQLLALSESSTWDPGPGWKWNREELYDRGSLRGHERAPLRGFAEPDGSDEEGEGK